MLVITQCPQGLSEKVRGLPWSQSTGGSTWLLFYSIRLVGHPDTAVQHSLDEHCLYLEETAEPGPARKTWHILGRLLSSH